MTEMSKAETRRFLTQGTVTGKLATVKEDGSSHVVPICFKIDVLHIQDQKPLPGIFNLSSSSLELGKSI